MPSLPGNRRSQERNLQLADTIQPELRLTWVLLPKQGACPNMLASRIPPITPTSRFSMIDENRLALA